MLYFIWVMLMNDIAKKIYDEIYKKKISYAELSRLTGISKSALQRYATGETTKMPLPRLEAIAKALDVSPEYLMGWDESTSAPEPTLTPTQQRAVDLIKTMSDDDLRKFISMGEILKGGKDN